jgi:receptor protein-tyrosine kinase
MNLIEQAAKRLEELRRAGADPTELGQALQPPQNGRDATPTPEALVRALDARGAHIASVRAEPARAAQAESPATAARAPRRRIELDFHRLAAHGYITPDTPRSQLADEFRVIKRPLISNVMERRTGAAKDRNLVMITSALPREGKSFTAINLALSIAMEMNHTVLLVDGDVASPSLPEALGMPDGPGLLDLLTRHDLSLADAMIATNVERLALLPAGSRQRRATELMASRQMATLMRSLASDDPDRIVIFDSPPLLPTTEARALTAHMGQIVLVVAAEATRQQEVTQALATLESCEIVLMLLNKTHKTDVGTYYGYYAATGTD